MRQRWVFFGWSCFATSFFPVSVNDETIQRFLFHLKCLQEIVVINQWKTWERRFKNSKQDVLSPFNPSKRARRSDAFCFVETERAFRFRLREWRWKSEEKLFRSHPNDFIQYLVIFQKYVFVPAIFIFLILKWFSWKLIEENLRTLI